MESTTINRFKSGLEKWWKDAPDKYDDNPNQTKPWIGTTVLRLNNPGSNELQVSLTFFD